MFFQPARRTVRPEPCGPECAAPSRLRHASRYTVLRGMQTPNLDPAPASQENRRSGGRNYINVIFGTRKKWCILGSMESKKALTAIAEMAGREHISMTEAAHALGVSISTISRREKDGWELKDLLALADAYGVSRTHLLLQLGYLDDSDLFKFVGGTGLKGVPFSALTEELHRRATGG